MKNSSWKFMKKVVTSRLGHLLLVINLCLGVYEFSQSRVREYETVECASRAEVQSSTGQICTSLFPAWIQIMALLDMPAIMVSRLITDPIHSRFPQMCIYTVSRVDTAVFLLCGSMQWLLVGYGIERVIMARRI
jgi:hypothetical protein